jgi:hypothetical protein
MYEVRIPIALDRLPVSLVPGLPFGLSQVGLVVWRHCRSKVAPCT